MSSLESWTYQGKDIVIFTGSSSYYFLGIFREIPEDLVEGLSTFLDTLGLVFDKQWCFKSASRWNGQDVQYFRPPPVQIPAVVR